MDKLNHEKIVNATIKRFEEGKVDAKKEADVIDLLIEGRKALVETIPFVDKKTLDDKIVSKTILILMDMCGLDMNGLAEVIAGAGGEVMFLEIGINVLAYAKVVQDILNEKKKDDKKKEDE